MRSDFSEHVPMHHDESRARFGRKFDARRSLLLQTACNIEGWAAAVAAVAVAGTAAYSSYSSSSAQKDALNYQANNTPQLHSYTPVLANYDPNAGVSQYLAAQNQYGYLSQKAANQENKYYQDSLNQLAPVTNSLMVAGNNTARELRGELPKDLSQKIARSSAQAALTGGYGADSGVGRNLTARDFGMTSLDLQRQGLQDLTAVQGLAARLNPVSGAQLIGDPSQYAARNDRFVIGNAQTQNDAAKDAAGIQNQNSYDKYAAGLAGVQASNISPYAGAISSGIGSAASAYFGYAGKQQSMGGYGAGQGSQNIYATPQYDASGNLSYSYGYGNPYG